MAIGADAFDNIFRLFHMKALRHGHGRDGHLGEAEGLVADGAGKMDVAVMVVMVLTMADTVFLCS